MSTYIADGFQFMSRIKESLMEQVNYHVTF